MKVASHPPAPLPVREPQRLEALYRYRLLDSQPEAAFDQITALAAYLLNTPIALLSLLDRDRQWFKSRIGIEDEEMPRDVAVCAYTILSSEGLVVEDLSEDERFAGFPSVDGKPWARFYAGMPLETSDGLAIGTLCVLDTRPRHDFGEPQRRLLHILAREAMAQADLRQASQTLAEVLRERADGEVVDLFYCRLSNLIEAASGMNEALESTLGELCHAFGWATGRVWTRTPEGELNCLKEVHTSPRHRNGHHRSHKTPPPDPAFAREAWDRRRPVEERRPVEGVPRTRVALPVRAGEEVRAVLEMETSHGEAGPVLVERSKVLLSRLEEAFTRRERHERLRRQEAELVRAHQVKDHFMATLAHELRNPLSPILSAVELLRTPAPGDALEIIERQVRHMMRLMEDLLDLSRVTSGKVTLYKSPMDLRHAVREAVRTEREHFARRHQPLEVEMTEEALWVEADPVRIEQIVGNLLHNASKYTGQGKPVALHLVREGGEAVLRVRDHGIGIPPEWQKRIFEPFEQAQAAQAMTRSGLGLGLALVRQMTLLHGGSVSVASEGRGRGSEFCVRLPLVVSMEGAAPPSSRASAPIRPHPAKRTRRVLIVEDNRDLRGTLKGLLTHWGHQVEVCSRGGEALHAALEMRPEVVLIDIGLPDCDGCQVARELREKFGEALRLIAISGYAQEADRQRALRSGFNDYLLKPLDVARLRELLAE